MPLHYANPLRRLTERVSGVVRAGLLPRCPLHRGEPIEPFFIVGAPRSGTTLLRRILDASPAVHVPPETQVLGRLIATFRRYSYLPWKTLLPMTLATLEYHEGFDSFGVSLRPLANRLKDTPPDRRSLALILDAFYRYHAERAGRGGAMRWGDKTPLNCFAMPEIHSVFPRAKFVHMLRDGVDAVHSHLRAGMAEDLDAAARRWDGSVAAVRAFAERHPSICHEVRYEALVADPEPVVRRLCEFLALPFEPAMLSRTDHATAMGDVPGREYHANIYKPISTDSLGKGRRELSGDQRARLDAILGAELRRHRYPAATDVPSGAA